MELRHLLFAKNAWVEDGKLCCTQIFDWIPVWRTPGVTAEQAMGASVPLREFVLAIGMRWSVADPPRVAISMRIVDGNGNVVFGPHPLYETPPPKRYTDDRPVTSTATLRFETGTIRLPGAGEYTFEIIAGTERLGGATLYLVATDPQA